MNPTIHSVQGVQAQHYYASGPGGGALLGHMFLDVKSQVFWEALDVATVLLEAGMVLAVLTWATTRVWFAIAPLLHLSVWLMVGIVGFLGNVVAYGFLVPWDRVPVPSALRRFQPPRGLARAAPLVVPAGIAWAVLIGAFGRTPGGRTTRADTVVEPVVLVAGALVGIAYVTLLAVRLVRSLRDAGDASTGWLIYDADCGFCTRSAQWLARRRPERVRSVPWQTVPDLATLGLSEHDVTERTYWQDASGALRPGHEAIAAALVARGGLALAAGRLIASPLAAPIAGAIYHWVATHRHIMPGSTAACRLSVSSQTVEDQQGTAE